MKINPDDIVYVYGSHFKPVANRHHGGFVLQWAVKRLGFGELTIKDNQHPDNYSYTNTTIDTETLGYEFFMTIFEEWIKRGKPETPENFYDIEEF